MQEFAEFRMPEEHAARFLPPGTGVSLGYGIRKIEVAPTDSLFEQIGNLHRELQSQGQWLFLYSEWHRRYTGHELQSAELLHIWPKRAFEPAGEECGTFYDESSACQLCGAGAQQITSLFLEARRIPRRVDFARTIADEVVTSRRVAECFRENRLVGAAFEPVHDAASQALDTEHFQLVATETVAMHPATRCGSDVFDTNATGKCPMGHIAGLGLLSEVVVSRESMAEADITATNRMVGVRRGLLRPRPLLLISPRAWRVIEKMKLKGLAVEVARLA